MLVVTLLSRQMYACRDTFITINICRDKHTVVATKDVFCRDKHMFVVTKNLLMAAPATDSFGRQNKTTKELHLRKRKKERKKRKENIYIYISFVKTPHLGDDTCRGDKTCRNARACVNILTCFKKCPHRMVVAQNCPSFDVLRANCYLLSCNSSMQ